MITIRKILAPTDFSNGSVPGVGYAISLAKDHAAEVIVLHVVPSKVLKEQFADRFVVEGLVSAVEPAMSGTRQPLENLLEARKQLVDSFLKEKFGTEVLETVKINPAIRLGKVVEQVVACGEEEQCDLIVMTSRASGFARLFRGSLTEQVVRRAPCPVVSIQPFAEVRTEKDTRVPVTLVEKWAA